MPSRLLISSTAAAILLVAACTSNNSPRDAADTDSTATRPTISTSNAKQSNTRGDTMGLTISSSAFNDGGMIPTKYTCDGEDISPSLSWSNVPDGTKSLALIADDPDAPRGVWVHWVIYNLPPDAGGLQENVPPTAVLDNHGRQGTNDFSKTGYGGPCPPSGTHRYFFKLYALDAMLSIDGDVTKARLIEAMNGHVVGEAEVMGRFGRE